MGIRKPDYFDRFQCIAGACSDNCCIGWEIDVDEERQQYYRTVPGELGDRLSRMIDRERGCFILQGKEERCPFLNRENLCDLILGLGESALCDICREHPRFYDWFPGRTEAGIGLCCEAAARLILGTQEPVRFVSADLEPEEDDMVNALFEARETAISILQDRQYSVWVRLCCLLYYLSEIQNGLDSGSPEEIHELADEYRNAEATVMDYREQFTAEDGKLCGDLICTLKTLEFMDPARPGQIARLEQFLEDPEAFLSVEQKLSELTGAEEAVYEQLAVYFIYRYFMKCRQDQDVLGKAQFTVFSVLFIRFLDLYRLNEHGILTLEDHVRDAVAYSKEIEYSEENMETLAEIFISQDAVSPEVLDRILHVIK